jgi:hypothetical protein
LRDVWTLRFHRRRVRALHGWIGRLGMSLIRDTDDSTFVRDMLAAGLVVLLFVGYFSRPLPAAQRAKSPQSKAHSLTLAGDLEWVCTPYQGSRPCAAADAVRRFIIGDTE